MIRKLRYNFIIGLEAIVQHSLRSFLTSLGIIFGVASVIAMLAIGKGAQQKILEQMNVLGVNNILINPIIEQEEGDLDEEESASSNRPQRFTPGLSMNDIKGLAGIPYVEEVSPEIVLETVAVRSGKKRSVKLVGVNTVYFNDPGFQLMEGAFFRQDQVEKAHPVCVIGYEVKTKFFPTEEPIGKQIKCGKLWLTVVGVLKPRRISREVRDELGIRNFDLDIYVPLETILLRYKNRSLITQSALQRARWEDEDEEATKVAVNYHQIDKIVVRVQNSQFMRKIAEICSRMLKRKHNYVVDFEIIVPELLLQQKQETARMFNIVLATIASISLLVGGIGIMNIMLASVLERIKEIGLRLAIGATKRDIILQFMSEAVSISVSGGIMGIILGISFSYIIDWLADIPTIISGASVVLSFFVALTVGLVFGIYPAIQAANQDPVISLRSGG